METEEYCTILTVNLAIILPVTVSPSLPSHLLRDRLGLLNGFLDCADHVERLFG